MERKKYVKRVNRYTEKEKKKKRKKKKEEEKQEQEKKEMARLEAFNGW